VFSAIICTTYHTAKTHLYDCWAGCEVGVHGSQEETHVAL
jgi:hypothetical protein